MDSQSLAEHSTKFYKEKLIQEGYTMSEMDPGPLHPIDNDESTFIALFVDDSFVFSNKEEHIQDYSVCRRFRSHYRLQRGSLPRINLTDDMHGDCKLSQKKLLTKLFAENPPLPRGKRWLSLKHPYGPAPAHNKELSADDKVEIEITMYLRLLGLLMYLTKSRPEIAAAVSFGASRSQQALATPLS
jgi:uncharacterized protein YifE (UPF0438 family)